MQIVWAAHENHYNFERIDEETIYTFCLHNLPMEVLLTHETRTEQPERKQILYQRTTITLS